ncbi:MAG: EVE domain-containing protein [Chitinophagales bacterium]|nr:EVE domain-containing protein [Chitinophagales bacterium]
MSDTPSNQYWLFQANPSVFRLKAALRLGVLRTFAVTSHKDKIKAGDKVILWQTGKKAACYGLAVVSKDPDVRKPEAQELPFFKEEPTLIERVELHIEYNLWSQPINKTELEQLVAVDDFHAGLPGTNFVATQAQYEAIEQYVLQQDIVNEPAVEYLPRDVITYPLNQVFYGPPGTGKTYQTINHALAIIEGRTLDELALEPRNRLRQRFNAYLEEGQIAFVTFHPSFSYEDFVEGIKPRTTDGNIRYEIEEGIFKNICRKATAAVRVAAYELGEELEEENTATDYPFILPVLPAHVLEKVTNYVLIIDEINRGNIPSIFGELITLLEDDKRAGLEEAITVVLPYSKQPLSVPPNLHILATMNTTDRSTEVLDMALRRRFTFKVMPARPDLIPQLNEPMEAGIQLDKMLVTINTRIALLLGDDYAIGHAYLLGIRDLRGLKKIFQQHIVPLLEEYFFNDYGKIGLVLGPDFVAETSSISGQDAFANFNHPYAGEYAEKKSYRLKEIDGLSEGAFIRIYQKNYEG